MSKKRERPRYRNPRRRMPVAGRDDSLATMLCNPVYGYGRWLEPREVVTLPIVLPRWQRYASNSLCRGFVCRLASTLAYQPNSRRVSCHVARATGCCMYLGERSNAATRLELG